MVDSNPISQIYTFTEPQSVTNPIVTQVTTSSVFLNWTHSHKLICTWPQSSVIFTLYIEGKQLHYQSIDFALGIGI